MYKYPNRDEDCKAVLVDRIDPNHQKVKNMSEKIFWF